MHSTQFLSIYACFFLDAGLFYALCPGIIFRLNQGICARTGFRNYFTTPWRVRLLGLGLMCVSLWVLFGLFAGR